jgi:hypothetical protein
MRFLFLFSFFILILVQAVSAPYGGETFDVMDFPECDVLNVTVQGELRIDQGEYEFLGCDQIEENQWSCACYDGYTLRMSTQSNTINDYEIFASYSVEADDEDNDGVADDKDRCPGSESADVDEQGCTAAQFCGSVEIPQRRRILGIIRCILSDWKQNEFRLFPLDCRYSRGECIEGRSTD